MIDSSYNLMGNTEKKIVAPAAVVPAIPNPAKVPLVAPAKQSNKKKKR